MAHDLNKKRILLVDADLRRSRISKYLGITARQGLADLLSDGVNVDDMLLNVGIDNLTILPAGKVPHNPAELLGSQKLKNLVNLFREKMIMSSLIHHPSSL